MTEREVIEAAFEVFRMQRGLDHGIPVQAQQKKAYWALMDAIEALANENDGRLVIREYSE
jgi:hypothetical protein